jgi:hypothetical protein
LKRDRSSTCPFFHFKSIKVEIPVATSVKKGSGEAESEVVLGTLHSRFTAPKCESSVARFSTSVAVYKRERPDSNGVGSF